VRVWALMTGDDPIAVDLYLTRADAEQDLNDAIAEEPEWRQRLRVEELELEAVLAPDVVQALEQLVFETVRAELAASRTESADRRWLTLDEASERLGVSADAVRMRVKRGRLDSRRQGRRLYVSAASVDGLTR
jgi:excisionase family DNA binding protein